ncbi:MAG: hypothetical protein P8J78_00960, partial [Maricaulis sp.]|nr:hypothetical protein [Maricaulis sp.]
MKPHWRLCHKRLRLQVAHKSPTKYLRGVNPVGIDAALYSSQSQSMTYANFYFASYFTNASVRGR